VCRNFLCCLSASFLTITKTLFATEGCLQGRTCYMLVTHRKSLNTTDRDWEMGFVDNEILKLRMKTWDFSFSRVWRWLYISTWNCGQFLRDNTAQQPGTQSLACEDVGRLYPWASPTFLRKCLSNTAQLGSYEYLGLPFTRGSWGSSVSSVRLQTVRPGFGYR
jgi:hypothetical protein